MRYRSKVMTVYVIGSFMIVMDSTMVNVALSAIADDYGVEATRIEWVAIGYLLALAVVIPLAGWLGDRFGSKRVFLTALAGFTMASVMCGLAQSLGQLIAFRVLQGVGGGVLTPVGLAMLYRAFPMAERAKAAIGIISVSVIAPAVGPVIAGAIVDGVAWPWIFYVNLPIGIVAVGLGIVWLREETQPVGRFDSLGLVLSAVSLTMILLAISTAPDAGWGAPRTIVLAVGGSIVLVALVVVELRLPAPMLHLRLYGDRLFRSGNVINAFNSAGFFAATFATPLYLQTLRDESAFTSGLVIAPQAIGIFLVANLFGARLYQVVGPRRLITVGLSLSALATGALALTSLATPMWILAAIFFARGACMGGSFVVLQTATYAGISSADTGRATSLFNVQRQVAVAMGTAITATIIGSAASGDSAGPYRVAYVVAAGMLLAAGLFGFTIRDSDAAATRPGSHAWTRRRRGARSVSRAATSAPPASIEVGEP
ncbi:MAG: MDR family MFS transporter [Ilumatobacteraceae bacterium]